MIESYITIGFYFIIVITFIILLFIIIKIIIKYLGDINVKHDKTYL